MHSMLPAMALRDFSSRLAILQKHLAHTPLAGLMPLHMRRHGKRSQTSVCCAEKKTGKQVQPVFISIDPERDSVQKVREYVKGFHPRMIGLTGPVEKVCHSI